MYWWLIAQNVHHKTKNFEVARIDHFLIWYVIRKRSFEAAGYAGSTGFSRHLHSSHNMPSHLL